MLRPSQDLGVERNNSSTARAGGYGAHIARPSATVAAGEESTVSGGAKERIALGGYRVVSASVGPTRCAERIRCSSPHVFPVSVAQCQEVRYFLVRWKI